MAFLAAHVDQGCIHDCRERYVGLWIVLCSSLARSGEQRLMKTFHLHIDPKPDVVSTVKAIPPMAGSSPRSVCPLDKTFLGFLCVESCVGTW